jgi:ankyrin repeat protein
MVLFIDMRRDSHSLESLGHLDLLQPRLDAGDDPSAGLIQAILRGRVDIVHRLLEYGAAYHVHDNSGLDLLAACKLGNADLVRPILDAGIDLVNCGDKCMKLACRMGMYDYNAF